jgi:protein-tyrosine phosphatase
MARPPRTARLAGVTASFVHDWIELDGAYNVRDLGGLPTATGITRSGVLLRADALDALTDDDVACLVEQRSLAHVFDLRSQSERDQRGRGRLGATEVAYSELEVIVEADLERRRQERSVAFAAGTDPEEVLALGYAELLDLGRTAFPAALTRLVAPGGTPALVHCAAGKDRTGVLVALLLDAAGVERRAIVADYAATQQRMAPIIERLAAASAFHAMAEQVPAFVYEARAGTMERFLALLDDRWGGAASFFTVNGADPAAVDEWRVWFVVGI